MKRTVLLLLTFPVYIFGFCQVEKTSSHKLNTLIYLDSIEINSEKTFLNPQSFESLDVVSPNKVYIKTKRTIKFYSVSDILKSKGLNQGPFLFSINNKLVSDTSNVRIDSSYDQNTIDVIRGDSIKYLPKRCRHFTFVSIILKDAKSEKEYKLK